MRTAKRHLWTAMVLCLLATTALSRGLEKSNRTIVPGVTAQGNVSAELGAQTTRKSYSDPRTGIVIELSRARVENKLGFPMLFLDTGLVVSPLNGKTQPSTADQLLVGRAIGSGQLANATLTATFDPKNPTPRTCYITRSSSGDVSCTCTDDLTP